MGCGASTAKPPAGAAAPLSQGDKQTLMEEFMALRELKFAESDDQLESKLTNLFQAADKDKSGFLDPGEVRDLFKAAEMTLTPADVEMLIGAMDRNDDKKIEYSEFVAVGVDMIDALQAMKMIDGLPAVKASLTAVMGVGDSGSIHNMAPDELKAALADAFKKADADSDGKLTAAELEACLNQLKLNGQSLSKREVQVALAGADTDKSGDLDVEEFSTAMTGLLTTAGMLGFRPKEEEALQQYLREVFAAKDAAGAGILSRKALREALVGADRLNLTAVQVHMAIAECFKKVGVADTGADDLVAPTEPLVAPLAAVCIRLADPRHTLRREHLAALGLIPPVTMMQEHFTMLAKPVIEKLYEGKGGKIAVDEFKAKMLGGDDSVTKFLVDLGLTHADITIALDEADKDLDGFVDDSECHALFAAPLAALSRLNAVHVLEGLEEQRKAGATCPRSEVCQASSALLGGAANGRSVPDKVVESLGGGAALTTGTMLSREQVVAALNEFMGEEPMEDWETPAQQFVKYVPETGFNWSTLFATAQALNRCIAMFDKK